MNANANPASEGPGSSVVLRISDEQLRRVVSPAFEEYRDAIVRATCDALAEGVLALAPYNCELNYDGSEDRVTAAWVEGLHNALDLIREFPEAGR